jgi:hypothetical protein
VNERQWQRVVTDLAELYGWSWAHFRPAMTERGWRTPVSGPAGAGFPDLVLVRDRVVFAELKSQSGRLRAEQVLVHADLRAAGAELHVWRPSQLALVRDVLRPVRDSHSSQAGAERGSRRLNRTEV